MLLLLHIRFLLLGVIVEESLAEDAESFLSKLSWVDEETEDWDLGVDFIGDHLNADKGADIPKSKIVLLVNRNTVRFCIKELGADHNLSMPVKR